MTRAVQWSREALDDLKQQLAYIAADNPAAAGRVADRIRDTGAALGKMPTGRAGRVSGSYEKVVTGLPYIIAYSLTAPVDREVISIIRVIHTSRDWQPEDWPE
ncbi:type II toxin-antitoxin system RelE/ParE family toxin [Mesorhizobium sp. INR15]|uniref:type II toxin-antitoxin system RelE/ParE family toxin n=1 Tax=Mesorhizobium sp. INR15 TaxID=2654248 RepID=UPI00189673F9|nr:type II toxin-antitoxin system RelE/ParE family toxin [Mesorhizobium sp. INR15]QPC91805.1 type II toxin-antitoxin system RelE/ParE family toxin [Mesorhizobium sp. INR15]